MRIQDVLHEKGEGAICVAPDASIAEAITLMSERRVGAVLIMADNGLPAGILSERDIVRLYARGQHDFESLRVVNCMTADPVTTTPDTPVDAALAQMTAGRFRHLPVLRDARVCGVVSIGDLVKARLREATEEAQSLRDYILS